MKKHSTSDHYAIMEEVLTLTGRLCSASEVHGAWTGFLSGKPEASFEQVLPALAEILTGENMEEAIPALRKAFLHTQRTLADEQFRFNLRLPDDETPLHKRAAALADWCQGFLYGLGASGCGNLSAQAEEILRDFRAISQLDPTVEGEEEEQALVELVEYVRIAAQLLYAEAVLGNAREERDGG